MTDRTEVAQLRTITSSRRATKSQHLPAETREADEYLRRSQAADVLSAVRGDDFPASAKLAAAFEEFARAAAELPGQPSTPLIVQIGHHVVAMQLPQDAADGLAKWVHHAAGACETQAFIAARRQNPIPARPALRLVPAGGSR
jgi:hypothetical protein